jgi:hypothetical protein
MVQVQVRGKVPGGDRDGLPDVLVDLEADVTAAELIRLAVEEQVRLLRVDAVRCRRALDRQYLSLEEIRHQAAAGAVRMPAATSAVPDTAAEVAKAQHAFVRGVFVVFAGGRQLRQLDEKVLLGPGEPVVFLRLTPLAGG